MARKNAKFSLDTRAASVILTRMASATVQASATRIADAAMAKSGGSTGSKAKLEVVVSQSKDRVQATVRATDQESEMQMRHGNYVAKSVDAGKV